MALQRMETALVSADETVVDFFAEVFELERLAPVTASSGVVHRLQAPGTVIKVMIPGERPAQVEVSSFLSATGLRYLTFYVDGLDGILERAAARGGQVQLAPREIAPGVRLAIIADTDGNAIELVEGTS